MAHRLRLPLAPERPARTTEPSAAHSAVPALATDRVVLALRGDEALVLVFAQQLIAAGRPGRALAVVASLPIHTAAASSLRSAGAVAVIATDDSFVGEAKLDVVRAWLNELPREAWVITAGSDACRLITPTFSVGLGRRHEMAAAATDLWLGQASNLVAAALVETR